MMPGNWKREAPTTGSDRHALIRAIATLGFFLALAPSSPGEPIQRKTEATRVDENTYRIVTRAEFWGRGLPEGRLGDALLEWWRRGIERRWNRGAIVDVEDGGRPRRRVRLEFRVITRRRKSGDPPSPGFHQIQVVPTIENLLGRLRGKETQLWGGCRSWIELDERAQNAVGVFASVAWPTVAAHEFGHIWGLSDEYDTETEGLARCLNSFRLRDWPPSLMDWSWLPLARPQPRHFRAIYETMRASGWLAPPGPMPP